jgi:hypothetical protein
MPTSANFAESSPSGWSIGNESWWKGGLSWTKDFFTSGAAQFSVQATEISPAPEPGVMLPLPLLLASGLLLRWRRK